MDRDMKAIINGKRYNTETATRVAEHEYGSGGDFEMVREALFCTPRGNWFLAGYGGVRSRYAEHVGHESWGGAGIRPIDAPAALSFLEAWEEFDAIEKYFYGSIEDA